MVSAISSAAPTPPVAASTGTAIQKPTQQKPQAAPGTDSAQLSQAAQAILANLKESRETSFQTTQEAGQGDPQARRLLAKETTIEADSK